MARVPVAELLAGVGLRSVTLNAWTQFTEEAGINKVQKRKYFDVIFIVALTVAQVKAAKADTASRRRRRTRRRGGRWLQRHDVMLQ